MKEFKVGDEVIVRGFIKSIDADEEESYPIKVFAAGTNSYTMAFTKDCKYLRDATERALFHLSELESGDSKHLSDEISDLKHELAQTKDYYSDLEKEVKSLRGEKATFTEEYAKVTLENDTLRNMSNGTSPDRDLIIKLKAQVEILKQLLIEMYETKNCK